MDRMRWLVGAVAALVFASPATEVYSKAEIKAGKIASSIRNDTSPPLRTMVEDNRSLGRVIANGDTPIEIPLLSADRRILSRQTELAAVDPAVQDYFGLSPMPEVELSFEGISNVNGSLPPDPCGAVGADHYVEVVNLSMAIWDKQGNPVLGPFASNTLFKGAGGLCESHNDGDPVIHYDQLADRWLYSQFALGFPNNFSQCIAISKTSDPTGEWHRYEFEMAPGKMNDYPKFGVWPDAYYMTINQFDGASLSWAGQGAYAFERKKMLQGLPAAKVPMDLYNVDHYVGAMLPSDLDGPEPPPAGTPNYLITFEDNGWGYPYDRLNVWQFKVDWSNPGSSTLTQLKYLQTDPFDSNMCGYSRNCIPQPNTDRKLDVLSDRLMYRLAYRNFGDHQSLVVNHTVDENGQDHAGIRWYELRRVNEADGWTIRQQGTYAPDNDHRWLGSIAMDGQGNMALGYAVSGSSTYPSVRYSGRLASDPLGELSQSEQSIVEGGGVQTHSSSRYGDYSAITVDPADDCTFWYAQEYYATTSKGGWRTMIGSFRFPSCTGEPTGALQGRVFGQDGNPLNSATVEAGAFSAETDETGAYLFAALPAGKYEAIASAYGYSTSAAEAATVKKNKMTALDFTLNKLRSVPVSGTVVDGSGFGWPLYAQIDISGCPESPVFTDPETGVFEIMLPEQSVFSFTVSAVSGGYEDEVRSVSVSSNGNTENFELTIGQSCGAPGYETTGGLFEDFNRGGQPVGWSVIDNLGNGEVWRFDDPKHRNNLTGGDGGFSVVDSDFYGPDGRQDTELWTPAVDFSELAAVTLEFDTDFNAQTGAEIAEVDLSLDNGATWSNVWRKTGGSYLGPNHETVDVSALAAGQASVIFRFRFYEAGAGWWWQVDNISIGSVSCNTLQGSLIVGNVYDRNTGEALNGTKIGVVDTNKQTISTIHSFSTFDDSSVDDGFYIAFAPAAADRLEAVKKGYGLEKFTTPKISGQVVAHNFEMPAARLTVTHMDTGDNAADVGAAATLYPGETGEQTLIMSNSGNMSAKYELKEIYAPASKPESIGLFAEHGRRISPKNLNDSDASRVRYYSPPDAAIILGGDLIAAWPTSLDSAWGIGFGIDLDELWLGNSSAEGGDKKNYLFYLDKDGAPILTGTAIDASWAEAFAADMAYDPMSGMLWQINVGGDNCIYELDPKEAVPTGEKICPAFGTSQRGLAFDWNTETFYAGSWNDAIIYHFDSSGAILDSKEVGLNTSGLAFNPTTNHLFVLNSANEGLDVYVLDVENYYAVVGGYRIEGLDDYDQAGLDIDCQGRLWAVDKNDQLIILAESGEEMSCGWKEDAIPWLSESPEYASVAAKNSQGENGLLQVVFTFDATNMGSGFYQGQVKIKNDAPYGTITIPVELTVLKMHSITADAGANGSINPAGIVEVKNSAVQSFIITPEKGFHIKDVLVDGDSVGTPASYTFKNVTFDHAIVATFSDVYNITATAGYGGAISPEGEIAAAPASDATFEILPEPGYVVDDVIVDGQTMGPLQTYAFQNINEEHEIHATFNLITCTITASAGENGSIDPLGSIKAVHGSSATFAITPDLGYEVADVQVDGQSIGPVSSYAFKSVSADHAINADFKINSYVITPEVISSGTTANGLPASGTITPSGPVTINYGESAEFTIAADKASQILNVQVDDEFVGDSGAYTFTKVNADHAIKAYFIKVNAKIFHIEVTAEEGGTVSPVGIVGVEEGKDQSFSIEPYIGYHISDVVVDGRSEGPIKNKIFSNISANHTLKASFARSSYTITAVAHENGSISPSGESSVLPGTDKTLEIKPDYGFQVDKVTVDGENVGAKTKYTIELILADHVIEAYFKPAVYTIAASKEGKGDISPAGNIEAEYGTSQTFEIAPMTYHEIADVLVDGASVGAVDQYTFQNVTDNHALHALFSALTHTVMIIVKIDDIQLDKGFIDPIGEKEVEHGGSLSLVVTEGHPKFYISEVLIDGEPQGVKAQYELLNITEDHLVEVILKDVVVKKDGSNTSAFCFINSLFKIE